MLEEIRRYPNPKFQLFVPFTRGWLVDAFLKNLSNLYLPCEEMTAIFYNDTDDQELQEKLRLYLQTTDFKGAKLYTSNNAAPSEFGVNARRQRIVDMKNASKFLLADGGYVICLEDDTFVQDPYAINRLINYIEDNDEVGFVSGVQRGRWGFAMIGAWAMDDINDPHKVWTLPYREHGVQEVDGAGWYCYITRTGLYKTANYRFEAECLGPDVCYVWDLRRLGYKCLVDWDVVCEHRDRTRRLVPNAECQVYSWEKDSKNQWHIIHRKDQTPTT